MRRLSILGIVALAIIACVPGALVDRFRPPTVTPTATAVPAETAEEAYYRGLYDSCVQTYRVLLNIEGRRAVLLCLRGARTALNGDWYEQPSLGWQWPLPALSTVTPTPVRGAGGDS